MFYVQDLSDVGTVSIIIIWNVISLVNFMHIALAHKHAELHFNDRALETELRKATGAKSVRAGSIAAWSLQITRRHKCDSKTTELLSMNDLREWRTVLDWVAEETLAISEPD